MFKYMDTGSMGLCEVDCFENKKKIIRRQITEIVQALDKEYSIRASREILENLKDISECKNANIIFCYVGRENEINTMPIIQYFLDLGKQVVVPKCVSKGIMEAYLIESSEDLEEGKYGILEPKIESTKRVSPDKIDLAIVPCITVNAQGYRLGYGGGFYDRYLLGTEAYRIVLCRERTLYEDIPVEDHDQKMNMVITENRIIKTDERIG